MDLDKKILETIEKINLKENIKMVILFGSQARGDFKKNSDIDLAFLMEEEYLKNKNVLDVRSELVSIFSSEIKKDCDIIFINQAPPLLKYQIVKYGRTMYLDKDFDYSSFFSLTLKEYFDFKFYQDFQNKMFLKRIKKGDAADGR